MNMASQYQEVGDWADSWKLWEISAVSREIMTFATADSSKNSIYIAIL